MAPSQDEQVKALPEIELDGENLVDDDSDMEQTTQEQKELAIEVPPALEATKKPKAKRTTAPPPQPLAVDPWRCDLGIGTQQYQLIDMGKMKDA